MVEEETVSEPDTEPETEPTTEPKREPEKPRYTCPHCGADMVPNEIPNAWGGTSYQCSECHKFMKLETPEEIKERKEEAKGPLPPLDVRLTERVKELLVKELPAVYGIPKKDMSKTMTAIIDTLTPAQATDPWNLHSHIKDFASNANDRHLESIINKIFSDVREEGYLPKGEGYQPRYDRRRGTREYRPRYAPRERRRERRYGEEGDYEDYERSRYMADQRFKREQAEERRREEEHDLRMRRLEAEILKITRETGGSRTEGSKIEEQGEERRREEEHNLRMKRLEAEILKITRETGGSTTAPPPGPYEEVQEFLDAEGNLCDPKKSVSVRIKRIPIGSKGLTPEEVRRIIREEQEQLTPEKVREIIRSEKPSGEPAAVMELKASLAETKKNYQSLKDEMNSEERKRLEDTIARLEGRIDSLRGEVGKGEYHEDTFRMLDSSVRELASIVKGRKPLDTVREILIPPVPSAAPTGEAGEAAHPSLGELRKRGLVVRLLERGR